MCLRPGSHGLRSVPGPSRPGPCQRGSCGKTNDLPFVFVQVLLRTTAGDIDIELWSKEAPKACRNFVQLCMEEYYNNTIFHRVVPGFIIQGGDPTGTGSGGDSIYGAPFKDEFHSRLRFNRRGLVAMANAGPHDNGSQFFFTLGRADELNNKHTIFGKVCYGVFCLFIFFRQVCSNVKTQHTFISINDIHILVYAYLRYSLSYNKVPAKDVSKIIFLIGFI
uniref:Peptidyl-prolyl cis-trans isomerase n=1 Tax=Nothoprocta perdicaria TaxID=30464 RepID=A0A8C7EI03_NOTPE